MSESWSVSGFVPEIVEPGTYPATVVALKKRPSSFGDEYVQWIFQPDGYSEDAQPAGSTSLATGATSKGMEWARRVLGKSDATDMQWGRELKERRPVVDWGPLQLEGKRCRIVIEKNYDDAEERYRNRVVNVLPVPSEVTATEAKPAARKLYEEVENFESTPF